MDITLYIIAFVISFVIAALVTPWVGVLAKIFDVIQYPPSMLLKNAPESKIKPKSIASLEAKIIAARRRLEKPPVANWGGIAYIAPFLVISIVILLVSKTINIPADELNSYILWFTGVIILFTAGIIDDKFELTGRIQILFHMLAAFLFVLTPIDLDILTNPIFGGFLDVRLAEFTFTLAGLHLSLSLPGDIFLFIWIIVMINAIKWQGGTDALMEGNVFVATMIMFIVSVIFMQPASALFSVVLSGTLLGFLIYNFYPAKIMSGSAGKSVIGFIVATLAIISNAKFAVGLVVFAIPLIDMIWVLIRRIIDYRPKTVFQLLLISDKSHFHHKLLRLGLTEVQIAAFQYTITFILGVIVIFLTGYFKAIFVLVTWIIVFLIISYVTAKSNEKNQR
jgi:UDP-GlcNAc:undecaprenyl-phosphate GlcNAc-1-phosphate transferase